MATDLAIVQIHALPADLESLLESSLSEGFAFVRRLCEDWASGKNRFALPGEAFFEAREGGRLLGICGLNRDPYAGDPSIGRIRHLYVRPHARRRGVGGRLVGRALGQAHGFSVVRVRTTTTDGDRFYRALGFVRVPAIVHATHETCAPFRLPAA